MTTKKKTETKKRPNSLYSYYLHLMASTTANVPEPLDDPASIKAVYCIASDQIRDDSPVLTSSELTGALAVMFSTADTAMSSDNEAAYATALSAVVGRAVSTLKIKALPDAIQAAYQDVHNSTQPGFNNIITVLAQELRDADQRVQKVADKLHGLACPNCTARSTSDKPTSLYNDCMKHIDSMKATVAQNSTEAQQTVPKDVLNIPKTRYTPKEVAAMDELIKLLDVATAKPKASKISDTTNAQHEKVLTELVSLLKDDSVTATSRLPKVMDLLNSLKTAPKSLKIKVVNMNGDQPPFDKKKAN